MSSSETYKGCISIKDGKIAAYSELPIGKAKQTIDADGLYLLPGMIDQHVHFMDPGENDREDFIHGSSAAAAAGVTTVIEHTHGYPIKNVSDFLHKKDYLSDRSIVDFGLAAHLWPGFFEEIQPLWKNGISYFKAFTCTTHGVPGLNNSQLLKAFSLVAKAGGAILAHCEDDSLTHANEEQLRYLNRIDGRVIQEWRSKEAEEIAVSNVVFIARMTGAQVTIAHVSHPLIIELVMQARQSGASVYTEICPQYMFLNDKILETRGSFGKFTPPARTESEATELLRLLAEGKIDILSTDHAPSTKEQKLDGDIWTTHFGLPGIDMTFPMMLTAVNEGKISLNRVVQIYSENPARRLGLYPRKGSLHVGTDADFVLVDLNKKWLIKDENIKSKAGWTPYSGMTCRGKAMMTFVRGQLVMEKDKIMANPGYGRYVKGG